MTIVLLIWAIFFAVLGSDLPGSIPAFIYILIGIIWYHVKEHNNW